MVNTMISSSKLLLLCNKTGSGITDLLLLKKISRVLQQYNWFRKISDRDHHPKPSQERHSNPIQKLCHALLLLVRCTNCGEPTPVNSVQYTTLQYLSQKGVVLPRLASPCLDLPCVTLIPSGRPTDRIDGHRITRKANNIIITITMTHYSSLLFSSKPSQVLDSSQ